MRAGIKIGYIEGGHIHDRMGKIVAYFSNQEALGSDGKKIAYISGDYIILPRNNTKVRIEDNNKFVGGLVPDVCRAAIRLTLG